MRKIGLSAKLIASVLILSVLLCITISYMGYREFTTVLEDQYNRSAYEIAETVKTYLNPDDFDRYLRTGETDEEYDRIEALLDSLVISTDTYTIYVTELSDGYTTSTYIYDAIHPDTGFSRYELGYKAEDMDPQYQEEVERMMTTGERSAVYFYSYSEASGAHTTAAIPVEDSSGAIVAMIGVEKAMTALNSARLTYVLHVFEVTAVAVILFLIIYIFFLRRSVITPILTITEEAQRFAQDNVEQLDVLERIRSNDEIGILASVIGQMETDIVSYVENLTAITAEKERIGAELSVATQIQADMLPSVFPPFPDRHEFDIYASMTPAKEVGGDFYDFFLIDDTHIALVMADVSGKGVPAALFMVIAKTMIKNRCLLGEDPSTVLHNVNDQLCENNEEGMFVTVWLGIYDITTGRLDYVNAGHEYPAVARAGEPFSLIKEKPDFVVAGMEGLGYRSRTLQLSPGDRLFLYTDGVPEATDCSSTLFGEERMVEALNEGRELDVQALLVHMKESVDRFVGDAEAFDDITMLAFDVRSYAGEDAMRRISVNAELGELEAVLSFVEEVLAEAGADEAMVYQAGVCIDELFSNIVFYSGASDVTIEFCRHPSSYSFRIIDDGRMYDPTAAAEPDTTLSAEDRAIGGLGIHIVRKFMDRMSYEYKDGRNIVTLEKSI